MDVTVYAFYKYEKQNFELCYCFSNSPCAAPALSSGEGSEEPADG